MRESRVLLRALGSLWLAVVLLVLLLVAMAGATAYESTHGMERAQVVFYHAWWFEMLLGLFGLNVLAATIVRFPFNRRQIGFVLTHASILLIFIGAWVTERWGIDGQVGIQEGQTASTFQINQESLAVERGHGGPRGELDLDPAITRAMRRVDLPTPPALALDGLQVAIETYLPDSKEQTQVVNDNSQEQIAVQVAIAAGNEEMKHWVFPDDVSENMGAVAIKLHPVADLQELSRLMAQTAASQPASKGTVGIEYQGKNYEFPLEQCTSQPAPVADTGYTIQVVRYLPHAIVGQDRQITNASSQPVNPTIEVEIKGPKGTSRRLAFARFPDFQSMHGSHQQQELKLKFTAHVQGEIPAPVEIYAARTGELSIRFNPEDGDSVTKMISPGQVVDTPWPGITFTIRERFDHARIEHTVVPVEPARENAIPAIMVATRTQIATETFWIRKGDSRTFSADGTSCRAEFGDKKQPLDFNITLDRFRVGYYPGTQRPRSFESQVTLADPATGREQSRVISMNRPTSHGGYTFYQSSYQQQPGQKSTSILSISWDPGKPVVFIGYIGMLVGMVWVLVLRMIDRRRAPTANDNEATQQENAPT